MRELETSRILLRPVEHKDLVLLLEMQWDREIIRYMKFNPISLEDQENWLKSLGKNMIAFTMLLKGDNGEPEVFGLCSLNNIDRQSQRASYGMKMKQGIQGKGLGYEASLIIQHFGFHHLNLHKIHADFLEENAASLGLVKKIGMRQEGLQVEHVYHHGSFKNIVLVGITKDEFYAVNKEKLQMLGLI